MPKSDLRVKSNDHLNFSRASVVQFWASRYFMCLNRTSELKVMTILISRELPLFNCERLYMWCAWIGPPSEKLWPYEFLKSFRCSILDVSIYYVPESDLRVKSFDHLNISRASVVQLRASLYVMRLIGPPSLKKWHFEFLKSFRCSISGVSIYYVPESDLRVNSYDHLNISRASVVQLRASLYVMRLNRTSEWKVMTIWIFQELPLLNFGRRDILCAWIRPPS